MTENIRSFLSVPIAPELAGSVGAVQESLRAAGPDVKWVNPESFHITLKFLGDVQRERLEALWPSVEGALDGVPRFRLRLHGVGAFPNPGRPRVIWAAVAEGATELTALAAAVEKACGLHGFAEEERPFRAHLTVGRVRRPAPDARLEAAIAEMRDRDLGEMEAGRVLLMRSDLRPGGPVYHILNEKLLSKGMFDE